MQVDPHRIRSRRVVVAVALVVVMIIVIIVSRSALATDECRARRTHFRNALRRQTQCNIVGLASHAKRGQAQQRDYKEGRDAHRGGGTDNLVVGSPRKKDPVARGDWSSCLTGDARTIESPQDLNA